MKRKLFTLFISVFVLSCFSSLFAQGYDSTYYITPLRAVKVFPITVRAYPIKSGLKDSVTLKIERINSIIPYEAIFKLHVSSKIVDTVLYQLPGQYHITKIADGNNIRIPNFKNTIWTTDWYPGFEGLMECTYEFPYADGVCGSNEHLDVLFNDKNITPLRYKWTPSEGLSSDSVRNPVVKLKSKVTYKVVVTTTDSSHTDSVTLNMGKLTVSNGPDKRITCGSTSIFGLITTNYTGGGSLKYKWTPSTGLDNDTIKNPTCSINESMTYRLTITTPEGCTATSSGLNVLFTKNATPEIGIVTVNEKKQNVIVWNKTAATAISKYHIYRETNVTDVFEKIGECSNDSLSVFVDSTSNAEIKSSKYKLAMIDKCGIETDKSAAHKTMHLSINKGQNNNWNLVWESYQGFAVQTYNIYRGSNAGSLSLIGSTSGSSNQFTDIAAPAGDVYYQIEIVAPTTISPSKIIAAQKIVTSTQENYNSSKSNIAAYITSGFSDLSSNDFQFYPNPVRDVLYIHSSIPVQFDVYNCTGICMFSSSSSKLDQLEVKDWKAGIYFIKTRNNEKVSMLKFIKE